jgi:hypothetical protein
MFRICNHLKTPLKFIKNIHGDMIYTAGGKRSIWVCTNCGKTILMDEPFYMGEVSDGYHTFNELYHHRAVLFSVICNSRPELAWKSKLHHDGTMYDGMFIVGIETPDGQATYHYDIDPYWNMFRVQELPQAPEWDGHTPAQAIERIGKLIAQPENEPLTLEELRQMDGEPLKHWVWIEILLPETWPYEMDSGYYRNILDHTGGEAFCCGYPGWSTGLPYDDYGKTWLAYRAKPERSEG